MFDDDEDEEVKQDDYPPLSKPKGKSAPSKKQSKPAAPRKQVNVKSEPAGFGLGKTYEAVQQLKSEYEKRYLC